MDVIWIMLPVALVLGGLAVWGFVASVRGGQLDDLDTPPVRMLFDDEETGGEDGPKDASRAEETGDKPTDAG